MVHNMVVAGLSPTNNLTPLALTSHPALQEVSSGTGKPIMSRQQRATNACNCRLAKDGEDGSPLPPPTTTPAATTTPPTPTATPPTTTATKTTISSASVLSLISSAGVAVVDASSGRVLETNAVFDDVVRSMLPYPSSTKAVHVEDTINDKQDLDVLEILGLPAAGATGDEGPWIRCLPRGKAVKITSKKIPGGHDDDGGELLFIEVQTIGDDDDDDDDDDDHTSSQTNAKEKAKRTGDDVTLPERYQKPILQRMNTVMGDPQEASQMLSNLRVDFAELLYLNRIGEGSFGDIFRAKYRGMTVAAKRIRKDDGPNRFATGTTSSRGGSRSDSDGNTRGGREEDDVVDMTDGSGNFHHGGQEKVICSYHGDDVRNGKRLSSARCLGYRKSGDGSDESDVESDAEEDSTDADADASALSDFRREVQILKTLRHPNIVLLLAYSTTPNNEVALYELMDCSLLDLLQKHEGSRTKMKPRHRIALAIDLCSGMHYLHSCRPLMVLHRDLKPSNCLMDSHGRLKLCDFGLSKLLPADRGQRDASSSYKMTGETGTYRFMAPEVYRKEPDYDEKVDVYSFAMIFYNILSGQAPWPTTIGTTVAFMTSRGERPPMEKKWDPRLQYLLKKCWHPDHTLRPSFARILDTLTSYQLAVHGGKRGSKNGSSARRRTISASSLISIF